MGNNDRKVFLFQVVYSWTETQLTAFIFCSVYVPLLPHPSFRERIMQSGRTGGMEGKNCKRPTLFCCRLMWLQFPQLLQLLPYLSVSLFSLCVAGMPASQPALVQRFCVILEVGLSLHGSSSLDCVYNFSQASSQHKYAVCTVNSHTWLTSYDNVNTVLNCPAWLRPSPNDRSNVFSNPWPA
jgi:hypothetical protein